ncbi:NUDIX domain-containing protein [Vibrio sp.]|uniref:NUDIX domain-containing protein n=1 Tax=Vibrio viridaestus TaxID=2487322 RepID=A0A3N9U4N7_9VIBR|nr:NUDIX hydrolase [Vibrio viridaestus]MDC0609723.1 NUDIX domain-containing protein [Vibrio sp.]RQW64592.1 NUDIX domain-containing protein [Vibrio viridaestus]
MRHLRTAIHPDLHTLSQFQSITRRASRAIATSGENILLIYTEKYDDYTLPGGGLEEGEDPIAGMIRELEEETGAKNIRNIENFGIYEEFRPWYKSDAQVMHMISFCYICTVDAELGETRLEHYEVENGSRPVWVNVHQAIEHNETILLQSHQKGLSIERETFLLRLVADEIMGY